MRFLLAPPSFEALIDLLRAWRLWLLAALLGALLAGAFYYLLPPPYRARATVNVDFNLEEAWPQETDRQHFYYLERESRKLEEIARSDEVLQAVSNSVEQLKVKDLRDGRLFLSQPAEAGWHFYAQDQDRARARDLASAWAQAFVDSAQANIDAQQGLNSSIRLELTQAADLPVERSIPLASYLLAGILLAWFLGALGFLFIRTPRISEAAPVAEAAP